MTMDMDTNPVENAAEGAQGGTERDDIISFLTYNKDICFKNQQRWEADLTNKEKFDIALKIFLNSKLSFLMKFGAYLKHDQLGYFEQFTSHDEPDWEEIKVVLNELYRNCSSNIQNTTVKNRRYEALKQMIQEGTYFSDLDMMKRNPLLYEQLVGQYLSKEEIKERDKYKLDENCTLVKILMEGIERDNAENYRKKQEENEDSQMEEEESESSDADERECSSPVPSSSRWGEFEEDKMKSPKPKPKPNISITAKERLLLKEEFITTMYQSFLDGDDEDFNYENVDNNASYDNIKEISNDEEDKYFASEEADENVNENDVSSEDELDIYMNALTQHPAVTQLSKDLKKL